MNRRVAIGHLASAAAYAIFGINVVVCRDIATDGGMSPIVLLTMRSLVACALFWLVSLVAPKERVPRGDLLRIAGAGVLGIFLPQLTFLHAIAHIVFYSDTFLTRSYRYRRIRYSIDA